MKPILAARWFRSIALALFGCVCLGSGLALADEVIVYPDAPLPSAAEFSVKANGQPIAVYNAGTFRCAPFAFSGSATVEVRYLKGAITSWQINPASKGIVGRQDGSTLRFTLTRPQKLEIQINGASSQVVDGDKLLYLFADAPETTVPKPGDQDVLYYGPGTHNPPGGILKIDDADPHAALYVAPGAVLNAALEIRRKKPFRIFGRGFIQNPSTIVEKKASQAHFAIVLRGCTGVVVEDVVFFNSVWHGIKFFGGSRNVVKNVKALHDVVNSDGISFHDSAADNLVENCLIIGNDNLIVIGGTRGQKGPSGNVVRGCSFIKSSYAGNWGFPQGDGPIGPGNVIDDCDVVRCNGQVGLIRMFYGKPTTMDNLVFQNIRVQSLDGYQPDPRKNGPERPNRFLSLETGGAEHPRTMTLKNLYLPSAQSSFIAAGKWTVIFDHVYVAGKAATGDADLHLTKGKGVVTEYVY
jgi:hypothetical protein